MDILQNTASFLLKNWHHLLIAVGLYLVSFLALRLFFHILLAKRQPKMQLKSWRLLLHAIHRPAMISLPVSLACLFLATTVSAYSMLVHFLTGISHIVLVVGGGWALIDLLYVAEEIILSRIDIARPDNLKARQFSTSLRMVRRLLTVLVLLLTLALIFLNFESVKSVGVSLLASAGVAGALIGFAGQSSLANVVAGLQIAFTQPIRLDDVLVVEGEWGKVEKITMTYVVLGIWDQRRLILPLKYFLEKPFQNWTYQTSELLGTVYLYVDYSADLIAMRAQLTQVLSTCKTWDGRVNVLQVTNCDRDCMEIRILVSASNGPNLWSARCEVREKMLHYLRSLTPSPLARQRWQEVDRSVLT